MGTWGSRSLPVRRRGRPARGLPRGRASPWDGDRLLAWALEAYPEAADARVGRATPTCGSRSPISSGVRDRAARRPTRRRSHLSTTAAISTSKRRLGMSDRDLEAARRGPRRARGEVAERQPEAARPPDAPRLRSRSCSSPAIASSIRRPKAVCATRTCRRRRRSGSTSSIRGSATAGRRRSCSTVHRFETFARYLVAILRYDGDTEPAIELFPRCRSCTAARSCTTPVRRVHLVSTTRLHLKRMGVVVVGNLPVSRELGRRRPLRRSSRAAAGNSPTTPGRSRTCIATSRSASRRRTCATRSQHSSSSAPPTGARRGHAAARRRCGARGGTHRRRTGGTRGVGRRDQRPRAPGGDEQPGVARRRRVERGRGQLALDAQLVERAPEDAADAARCGQAALDRDAPLDDQVGAKERQPRIVEQPVQQVACVRKRDVRDDAERLVGQRNRQRVAFDDAHVRPAAAQTGGKLRVELDRDDAPRNTRELGGQSAGARADVDDELGRVECPRRRRSRLRANGYEGSDGYADGAAARMRADLPRKTCVTHDIGRIIRSAGSEGPSPRAASRRASGRSAGHSPDTRGSGAARAQRLRRSAPRVQLLP